MKSVLSFFLAFALFFPSKQTVDNPGTTNPSTLPLSNSNEHTGNDSINLKEILGKFRSFINEICQDISEPENHLGLALRYKAFQQPSPSEEERVLVTVESQVSVQCKDSGKVSPVFPFLRNEIWMISILRECFFDDSEDNQAKIVSECLVSVNWGYKFKGKPVIVREFSYTNSKESEEDSDTPSVSKEINKSTFDRYKVKAPEESLKIREGEVQVFLYLNKSKTDSQNDGGSLNNILVIHKWELGGVEKRVLYIGTISHKMEKMKPLKNIPKHFQQRFYKLRELFYQCCDEDQTCLRMEIQIILAAIEKTFRKRINDNHFKYEVWITRISEKDLQAEEAEEVSAIKEAGTECPDFQN